ncbi:MAG: TlpA disulfide reductase family protein [Pseudomonadota bacterium]
MTRTVLSCIAACLVLAGCNDPSGSAQQPSLQELATGTLEKLEVYAAPQPLPDVMITVGDEEAPTKLANAVQGPALINLWATWCAPCVKELPSLAALSADTGLPIYAVAIERGKASKLTAFLEKHEAGSLKLLRDPDQALPVALEARGVPITMAVNADGDVIAKLEGEAEWTQAEARQLASLLTSR